MSSLLVEHSPGLDGPGVRAAGRLGQGEGSELFSSGKLGQILGLLLVSPAQQDSLEPNGLVSTDEDADTEIVPTNNLGQPGVLSVGETHTVQLHGNLESKESVIDRISSTLNSIPAVRKLRAHGGPERWPQGQIPGRR